MGVAACAGTLGLVAAAVLLLAGASSFALMEACGQYAVLGLVTRPGTLPFAAAAGWPQSWLWVPGNAAFALVPLFFPDVPRPPGSGPGRTGGPSRGAGKCVASGGS